MKIGAISSLTANVRFASKKNATSPRVNNKNIENDTFVSSKKSNNNGKKQLAVVLATIGAVSSPVYAKTGSFENKSQGMPSYVQEILLAVPENKETLEENLNTKSQGMPSDVRERMLIK